LLLQGVSVTQGYHNCPEETATAFRDGWFATGDLASIDDTGHLRITGRKKEIIVTAGGKNVSPEVLEDSLQTHPLISTVILVGDGKPYIGALITLDAEMLPVWCASKQLPDITPSAAVEHPAIRASLEKALTRANQQVSRAESIRRYRIVDAVFTVENGYLTPSLKLKRHKVLADFADEVEAIYEKDSTRSVPMQ
ncbi:MAG: long-chain fatty acid--CoA ligase, partial [Actinobacteria bacterium]